MAAPRCRENKESREDGRRAGAAGRRGRAGPGGAARRGVGVAAADVRPVAAGGSAFLPSTREGRAVPRVGGGLSEGTRPAEAEREARRVLPPPWCELP